MRRPALLATAFVIVASCGAQSVPAADATASPSPSASPTATPLAIPAGAVRFVATDKSAATVRVEEHLAANTLNTDAVLTFDHVTGALTLLADGSFGGDSKIVVDMTRLKSNEPLRDKWLSLFGIETNKFRESTFTPERATGLPAPLPLSGEWSFTLAGRLTVHGVAKPVTWQATAKRDGRVLTGRAATTVHWADFDVGKPQPAVFQIVSVSDDIRLELIFAGSEAP